MTAQHVLVTGGSGFIAGHCILALVAQGHRVRTTVRSLAREAGVRAQLAGAGLADGAALSFVEADLTDDAGWAAAVQGIDRVLHVASPVHLGKVRDENDVIAPARDGTLRVLRAAHDAGVRRVVMTSAFHAVGFGHRPSDRIFTEQDWSVPDGPGMDAYGRSKIAAERAAWDFATGQGGGTELTTLLPVAVMGPVLGREVSGANHLIQRLLSGQVPGYPDMYFPIVDVRDVAAAHVAAMTAEGAAGQRILVAGDEPPLAMRAIGEILRQHLGAAAGKVPTRAIPDLVVRLAALVSTEFRPVAAELGYRKQISNASAHRLLGLRPRPAREAIVAAADSMIAASLVAV